MTDASAPETEILHRQNIRLIEGGPEYSVFFLRKGDAYRQLVAFPDPSDPAFRYEVLVEGEEVVASRHVNAGSRRIVLQEDLAYDGKRSVTVATRTPEKPEPQFSEEPRKNIETRFRDPLQALQRVLQSAPQSERWLGAPQRER